MISSKIVQEQAGLTTNTLEYLRRLRLIPSPTRIPTPGCTGSAYAYPPTIFTRIHLIKFLQGHGFTLTKIARAARGTPFECPPPGPPTNRKVAP